MKSSIGLLFVSFVAASTALQVDVPPGKFNRGIPEMPSLRSGNVKWGNFSAKVDNFDEKNNATFTMRYTYNLQFAKAQDAPLLIYVGGEWEIKESTLETGQIFTVAQENEGAMYATEHRFYGKSFPIWDYKSDSLKLLSSQQGMEDLVQFIKHLKESPEYKNSKVVLFGCSYSASLATWTQVMHPDLISSIYSSSGPLEAKADMYEFLRTATYVIQATHPKCAEVLKNGVQGIEALYLKDDKSRAAAQRKMGICVPKVANEPLDRATIFEQIGDYWGGLVQSDLNRLGDDCDKLLAAPGETDIEKFGYFMRKGKNETYCEKGNYDNNKRWYLDTTIEGGDMRPFYYQRCHEFGWFLTTNGDVEIFGTSVQPFYFWQLCRDAFGETFTDAQYDNLLVATNKRYGAKNPKVHHAVFMQGRIDPWGPVGMDDSLSDDAVVFQIDGTGHCWDMFADSPNDNPIMANAKRSSRALLKKWLAE